MAQYATLKAAIDAVIKANGQKEITGTVLNEVLTSMVNSLGANYQFAGVATPSTNPGTPDQNEFYLAGEGGTYTNFNNIAIPNGISCLIWNGSWSSQTVLSGDGGVFDISAYKATGGTLATFADLSAALGVDGANVPVAFRKGGMSVKFVQGSAPSSDNKYVQFRCIPDEFTTDVTQWAIDTGGVYVENPKYGAVWLDKYNRILFGVQRNGNFYFGAGVPQQIVDYVLAHKAEIIAALTGKVDKQAGKSLIDENIASSNYTVENPDYLSIVMDSLNRISEATDKDGNKIFYADVKFPLGIPTDIKNYFKNSCAWNGKKLLAIGDSVTAPGKWQAKVGELLNMKVATHAKGGINIIEMVDGKGDLAPLSAADVADVDVIIAHGFYNERPVGVYDTYRPEDTDMGNEDDMYPTQDTFCGRLNYLVDRIYECLAAAGNTHCKICLSTPHKYGAYPYNANTAYVDGEIMCDNIKKIANRHSLFLIDCQNGVNINKYNWDIFQSSPTPVNDNYLPGFGENDGTYRPFDSISADETTLIKGSFEASAADYNGKTACLTGVYTTGMSRAIRYYVSNGTKWVIDHYMAAPWAGDQLHPNLDGQNRIGEFIAGQLATIV